MHPDWPFSDPPNVAVFTVRRILKEGRPILRVCHDEDDGPAGNDQAMRVSPELMLRHDPTIAELADLPPGWEATRSGPGQPWTKGPQPEAAE